MIRIAGVILPQSKHICVALRSIYGIGQTRSLQICEKVGVEPIKVGGINPVISCYSTEWLIARRVRLVRTANTALSAGNSPCHFCVHPTLVTASPLSV